MRITNVLILSWAALFVCDCECYPAFAMQSAGNGIRVRDHYRRKEIRAYDVNLCTVQALISPR